MSKQTPRSLVYKLQNSWHNYDPRMELDKLFWSQKRQSTDHTEIEQWCNEVLGEDNWYRMFDKYWFTSESDCVMFRLMWATGVTNEQRV